MNASLDARVRRFLLRVLLDQEPGEGDAPFGQTGWSAVLRIAQQHGVLLRAAARLAELAIEAPAIVQAAVAREEQRVSGMLALIRRVDDACCAGEVPHVFLTMFESQPDAGRDVDLLVLDRAAQTDRAWLAGLRAQPLARDLTDRLAGATRYAMDAGELDVHHGRLGIVGEDAAFARLLLSRHRRLRAGETELFAPSAADYLVLHSMRRVYTRRPIRLKDVISTVRTVRSDELDWDETVASADRFGVLAGLSCYLGYVEQVHRDVVAEPLLPPGVARNLLSGHWGRIGLNSGSRFPTLRASARLYLRKLVAKGAQGSWDAVGRLCLIPVLGAAAAVRNAGRR